MSIYRRAACLIRSSLLLAAMATPVLGQQELTIEQAQQQFDSIFAEAVQRAARTPGAEDDLEVAKTIFGAAQAQTTPPALRTVLCRRVYDLLMNSPAGYDTAIEVMTWLAEQDETQAPDARTRIRQTLERKFTVSSGDEKATTANMLIDQMSIEAASLSHAGKLEDAISAYQQAMRYAIASRNVEARTTIRDAIASLNRQLLVRRRIDQLKEQLKANAQDADAARQLLLLYVVDLDRPEEAMRFTFLLQDDPMPDRIRNAIKDLETLEEATLLDLGDWYRELSDGKAAEIAVPLLARSVGYYERYLQVHEAKDLYTTKAKLSLDMVSKRLEQLSKTTNVTPRVVTAGVPRFTGKPLVLEAEKATIGGPIAVVKDETASGGAFVWDPQRDAKLRGTPGAGRVVFLVQVSADTTATLAVRTWAARIQNDSYYLAVVPGKASEGPPTEWLFLTHDEWTWVPFKRPIKLTRGLNSIIFMTREEKSRLDAIRLTAVE